LVRPAARRQQLQCCTEAGVTSSYITGENAGIFRWVRWSGVCC
jgi:hypothetical protein